MRRVEAVFVEGGGRDLGRCFVRDGYCVFQVNVVTECSTGIARVCGEVNEGVAIE